MLGSGPYARPPIVEAVIDFQFSTPWSVGELERLRERFKSKFPTVEAVQNIQVSWQSTSVSTATNITGFKMTAKNAVDLLLIQNKNFASVRLAPYDGWEGFFDRAVINYEGQKKIFGRRDITRIGVRFINRIDIPLNKLEGHDIREFFQIGVDLPSGLARSVTAFSVAAVLTDSGTGMQVKIQGGNSVPTVLEKASFLLDIDVYVERDIPGREDDLWKLLGEIRNTKNRTFELCITDAVRGLFNE
jgi:uncharacterized protein (TIGR04255 family)